MKLKPNAYYANILKINFQKLKEQNIKVILLDIDNTLINVDTRVISKETKQHIKTLTKDFQIILISNNRHHLTKTIGESLNLQYYYNSKKPFSKIILNDLIWQKYEKNQIIMIGDKISTDVMLAKRLKINSILVDPINEKSHKWYSKLMQLADLCFFKIANIKKGDYYDEM